MKDKERRRQLGMAHTQAVLALRKLRREKRDCEVILGNRVNSKPASGGLPKEILSQKKKKQKTNSNNKNQKRDKKKRRLHLSFKETDENTQNT
jgi:hypothetical protein